MIGTELMELAGEPLTIFELTAINQRVVLLVEHPVNAASVEDDTRFSLSTSSSSVNFEMPTLIEPV